MSSHSDWRFCCLLNGWTSYLNEGFNCLPIQNGGVNTIKVSVLLCWSGRYFAVWQRLTLAGKMAQRVRLPTDSTLLQVTRRTCQKSLIVFVLSDAFCISLLGLWTKSVSKAMAHWSWSTLTWPWICVDHSMTNSNELRFTKIDFLSLNDIAWLLKAGTVSPLNKLLFMLYVPMRKHFSWHACYFLFCITLNIRDVSQRDVKYCSLLLLV